MRQVVLDTETTGLEPKQGHRIIEIGCVEIRNRRKTNRQYHQYFNPGRSITDGAYEVHGLDDKFLADKPLFSEQAKELIDFIKETELIIHNADFDINFINAELEKLGPRWGKLEDYCTITDTLNIARAKHPGQKNSLSNLCKRYNIDSARRKLHGALLDAQLLADVYLAMTGGQTELLLNEQSSDLSGLNAETKSINPNRPRLKIIEPSDEELAAHRKKLDIINTTSNGKCIWNKLNEARPN